MTYDKDINRAAKAFLLIFGVLFLMVGLHKFASAHEVPWTTGHENLYKCIKQIPGRAPVDIRRMSPITKFMTCRISEELGLGDFFVTDGCREASYHDGKWCMAMDGYYGAYPSDSDGQIQKILDDAFNIATFLDRTGLGKVVGFGFYAGHCEGGRFKSDGLFFHLDSRGKRARWARVGGKYVTFEEGVDALAEALGGC